jgi:hypothetical protein
MTQAPALLDDGTIVRDGVPTLGPAATRLVDQLDSVFVGWAADCGAAAITVPPMQTVADLATLDVYQNFPHLSMVAATIGTGHLPTARPGQIEPGSLQPAMIGLPSAVCYGVYLHLRGRTLPTRTVLTAMGTCFRNESYFDGLRRLRVFRLREVVALGRPDEIRQHLSRFTTLSLRFADVLGLDVAHVAASDPFFDQNSPQAHWQQLDPVKHEVLFGDLAIASVNEHRKFFGERCAISLEGGGPVSTGCVGWGLERWVQAVMERYRGDWDAAYAAVEAGRAATAGLEPQRQPVKVD